MTRYTYRILRREYLDTLRLVRKFQEKEGNKLRIKLRMELVALRVAYYY